MKRISSYFAPAGEKRAKPTATDENQNEAITTNLENPSESGIEVRKRMSRRVYLLHASFNSSRYGYSPITQDVLTSLGVRCLLTVAPFVTHIFTLDLLPKVM